MPTIRLDKANVLTLPAVGGRRTTYRDDPATGIRGLVLRVSPTGARSYSLEYSRHGINKRYSLGSVERVELAEARKRAKALYAAILTGADPQAEKRRQEGAALTVDELVRQMLASVRLKPSTRYQWQGTARRLISPTIGRRRAADVTRQHLRETCAKFKSPYQADVFFRVCRRAYSWGVENDLLPGTPFTHLKLPHRQQLRESERVLTPEEVGHLWRVLGTIPGRYSDATKLLLLTMVRRDSVIGMRWDEVDLDSRLWVIPGDRSKSGRPYSVPLSETAVKIIAAQPRGDYVFPPARGRAPHMHWSSRWVRVLRKKLKGQPWRIHDLRRTGATLAQEVLRLDRDLVRLLLGHAPPSGATRLYLRSERLQERREALDRWAAQIVAWGAPGARQAAKGRAKRNPSKINSTQTVGKARRG